MKLRLVISPFAPAAVCLLCSAMAMALPPQEQASAAPADEDSLPPITVQIAPPTLSISSPFGQSNALGGQPALGKPLAAEIVTEHHQTFADGNRISRSTQASLFRDAAGRLRRESQLSIPGLPAGALTSAVYVTIVDRELGYGFVLDPQERVAHRYPLNAPPPAYMAKLNAQTSTSPLLPPSESGSNAPATASNDRWSLRGFPRHLLHGGGAPPGRPAESDGAGGMGATAFAYAELPPEMSPQGPPPVHLDQPFLAAPYPVRTENLGEQKILGYRCTGSRVITTLQTGQIGNDRPINIVSEQWYSPELEMVMRSMHRDPWAGELVTTVIHVSRGEQPAPLFAVPASYKIVDASDEREHHLLDGHDHTATALK
ncbi:MAG: hypothetical protein P4M01_14605 [Acidobacteriota bacterium]|nr:hypothetical protein [Acidobacteriota bacterium]